MRLRDATLGTDVDELDEAIWLFETHELVDNGDLTNALDRLDFLQLRQGSLTICIKNIEPTAISTLSEY